jgi:hypothetical protein
MAAIEPVGDLEHERDLTFQRREWRAQRIGWVVMVLLLLVGLSGILGSGPLSTATVASGPLQFDYARFERRHAPTEVEVAIGQGAVRDEQVALWLSTDYLEAIEITSIMPEPEEVEVMGDRVVYHFAAEPAAEIRVVIALEHDEPGLTTGRVGLVDGEELAWWQVVYP